MTKEKQNFDDHKAICMNEKCLGQFWSAAVQQTLCPACGSNLLSVNEIVALIRPVKRTVNEGFYHYLHLWADTLRRIGLLQTLCGEKMLAISEKYPGWNSGDLVEETEKRINEAAGLHGKEKVQ